MKKVEIFIIAMVTYLAVLPLGCLKNTGFDTYVGSIEMVLPLDYNEVISINYTLAEQELEKRGYPTATHLSSSLLTPYELAVTKNATDSPHGGYFNIHIQGRCNDSTNAYVKVHYDMKDYVHNNEDVENDKGYVQEKGNEVAEICNLTLNWDNAKWTVNKYD